MGRPKPLEALMQEAHRMDNALLESTFAKGVAKGVAQTYADLIHKLLVRWLGRVDEPLRSRIETYPDRELVEAWYDEAVEIKNAEAARKLLDKILHTPQVDPADKAAQTREALIQSLERSGSALYKSIFANGVANGVAKSVAKGDARGAARIIHKILARWLGSVDASVCPHIEAFWGREVLDVWCREAVEIRNAKSARKLLDKILRTPVPPSADGSSHAA